MGVGGPGGGAGEGGFGVGLGFVVVASAVPDVPDVAGETEPAGTRGLGAGSAGGVTATGELPTAGFAAERFVGGGA